MYSIVTVLNVSISVPLMMRVGCFSNKPSGELQAFFRRNFSNVTFIQGTVLDIPTLKLAKVCLPIYSSVDFSRYQSLKLLVQFKTEGRAHILFIGPETANIVGARLD